MRIGIVGAGRIGGGLARQLAGAGHQLKLSFSRDPAALGQLAQETGPDATAGIPAEAVGFGEVVVISVPWSVLPQALGQAGPLAGKIVIDTTNQFGAPPLPAEGQTAAQFNAARMPGAHYTKSFNTLTSAFQADAARRHGNERVVQWLCGDDPDAKRIVAGLIEDAGFIPVDLGGTADCAVMESPARGRRLWRGVPRRRCESRRRGRPGRARDPGDSPIRVSPGDREPKTFRVVAHGQSGQLRAPRRLVEGGRDALALIPGRGGSVRPTRQGRC